MTSVDLLVPELREHDATGTHTLLLRDLLVAHGAGPVRIVTQVPTTTAEKVTLVDGWTDPAELVILQHGIGSFVARYPRYAKLFGPVSISQDYTPISRGLIVRYQREQKCDPTLAPFVHPTNPYHDSLPAEISPRLESIEQVSARVAEVEPDGKGVPVLLRQYLKLNATLLEFNIDPDFADCLDALVMVDLRSAPASVLKRYMGKAAYRDFLEAH